MRSAQYEQKILRVMNAVAAGTTDQTTSVVDMTADGGWESAEFVAAFGTLTAGQVTKMKIQQSSDDGVADAYSDLAGSLTASLADGDSNKFIRYEVLAPEKAYLKAVLDRGTQNAVIDGVFVILRRGRKLPLTQSSTVAITKSINRSAEGTA